MKNKRKTIGILTNGIQDEFNKRMCKGIIPRAEAAGYNIVVIPGKHIFRNTDDETIKYDYQFSTLFSYAGPDSLDGLIVAANCICCFTDEENTRNFIKMFGDIPIVLASTKMEGFSSVVYDNYSAVDEIMSYLVKNLKYTKIGMIGAAGNNSDAIERREAFFKCLKKYSIEADENRYTEGQLIDSDASVFRDFLDANPDIQAVLCVNDHLALGLYGAMKQRGLIPGRDIAVTGFDNNEWDERVYPSLSSVAANPEEIGRRCFENLVYLINGIDPGDTYVPTKFIRRESVPVSDSEDAISSSKDFEKMLLEVFNRCARNGDEALIDRIKLGYRRCRNMCLIYLSRLDDSVLPDLERAADELFYWENMQYADAEKLNAFLDAISQHFDKYVVDEETFHRKSYIQTLFSSRSISGFNYVGGIIDEKHARSNNEMKQFVRDLLHFNSGDDDSYLNMVSRLDWLGINNAYVFLLDSPVIHHDDDWYYKPSHLYMKAARHDERTEVVSPLRQKFCSSDIFNEEVLDIEERFTLVLLPLFYNEIIYGYFLCDLTEDLYENGDFFANQLSTAAKLIDLLKYNEQMLFEVRQNNLSLDKLSKSDGLTGIYNRRGFMEEANNLYKERIEAGQTLMVIYADMNSLKKINDMFGHDHGDFALETIGGILSATIGRRGIVGRIGGDEFAGLLPVRDITDEKDIIDMINGAFDDFNNMRAIPYIVSISVGSMMVSKYDNISLEEALKVADSRLYEAKKYKKGFLRNE